MAIAISCPACDHNLRVKDELAGRKIRCPECSKVIAVPREEEDTAPEREQAPRPKKKKKGVLNKDVGDMHRSFNNFDVRRFTPGDYVFKVKEYARAGIAEYWIIDPDEQLIRVLVLDGQSYRVHGDFRPGMSASSALLPGFTVAVDDVLAAGK